MPAKPEETFRTKSAQCFKLGLAWKPFDGLPCQVTRGFTPQWLAHTQIWERNEHTISVFIFPIGVRTGCSRSPLRWHLSDSRLREVDDGIRAFLIYAPNHIAAAAKLAGWLVADIFEFGALDAAFERRDPAV